MPKRTRVKVEGLDHLKRRCRTLPADVRRAAAAGARAAAEMIADEAARLAPVDTGLTRSTIKVEKVKRRKSVEYEVVVDSVDFPGDFYPPHVEFGTSKMEPRPFLAPAFEREKKAAGRVVAGSVKAGVELGG